MGCDIHLFVAKHEDGRTTILWDPGAIWREERDTLLDDDEYDTHWKHTRRTLGRNYERFARLSGVRGDGPEANGWPWWAQEHADFGDADLHSHTWYPIEEAARIFLDTEYGDDEFALLAKANPVAMYFHINPDEHDLSKVFVCISYDN